MLFQEEKSYVGKQKSEKPNPCRRLWTCKQKKNLENIDRYGKEQYRAEKNELLQNKKERIRSLRNLRCLPAPLCRKRRILPEKVSFCTSLKRMKRASLAVETALVLPLFFLGMVTMVSFMDIYRIQTEHLVKLCEKAKKAGMYAYVLEGSGQREITLPDIYSYEPIGGLIPLPKVLMHNTVKVHAWTGEEYSAFGDGEGSEPEEMVYVAESGTVFHKNPGCSYLSLSITQTSGSRVASMRNAYGEKYGACEICSRNQNPAGSVYITSSGNRYHNLESCSGLKRTVRLVKHSCTGNMAACSRCG